MTGGLARLPIMAVATAAAVVIFGGRAAAESACPAAVSLRGDAGPIAAVGEELARRGLAIQAREGCQALSVEVWDMGESIRVEIADAAGRRVTRKLAGVRATATVIESWARHDVAAPLLAPAAGTPAPAAAAPAGAAHAPQVAVAAVSAAPLAGSAISGGDLTTVARSAGARRASRFTLALRSEASVAFDASTSAGAAASGCARLGPLCVGLVVRAHKSLASTDDAGATQVERTGVDAALLVETRIRIGRAVLAPGVTIGGGWLETRGIPGGSSGHSTAERVATRGGRAGAQVVYSAPLTPGVAFEAAGSFDVAFAAHGDPFVFLGDTDCTTIVRLPGEPRAWVHAGVGLRVDL